MKVPETIEIGLDLENLNKRMDFIFNAVYMMMKLQHDGYQDINDNDICGFLEETSVLKKNYEEIQERIMKVGKA